MKKIIASFVLAVLSVSLFNFTGVVRAESKPAITWIRQFGSYWVSEPYDYACGVATDESGDIYLAGQVYGTLPGQMKVGRTNAFVRKYDGVGNELWTRQFGIGGEWNTPMDMTVDGAGNVYTVGYFDASYYDLDAFVRKYDAAGNIMWTRQFGSSSYDHASGVAVDVSGNVYVVGWTQGALPSQTSMGGADAFVRKYDTAGIEQWTRQFGTSSTEAFSGVAVDRWGDIYVVGYTNGTFTGQTPSGGGDAFIRKYDSAGNEQWTLQFGSSSWDSPEGVVVDVTGNVCIVGSTGGRLPNQPYLGNADAFVRKYDRAGNELWTRQFGTGSEERAFGIALDVLGNIYVVGYTGGSLSGQTFLGGYYDAFVRKYDDAGNEEWTVQFGTNSTDSATGVAVDRSVNIYVVGSTNGAFPGYTNTGASDVFIVKFLLPPDTIAPTTTAVASPPANGAGWNNTDVTVSLTTVDNPGGAGVKEIRYSISGGAWVIVLGSSASVALSAEGIHTVAYYAVDNAGNTESPKSLTFRIDKAAPTVTITSPQAKDYLHSESVTLDFVAADALSGIDSTVALLDTTPVTNGQVADLRTLTLGQHTLTINAVDKAGNSASTAVTFNVKPVSAIVDVKPDTLNKAIQSDKNAVTVYIEVPGYDVNVIDVATVTLSTGKGSVPAQLKPTEVGDYDNDGVPDRMMKFDRQAVIAIVDIGDKVKITISGRIAGAIFEESDEVRVIDTV